MAPNYFKILNRFWDEAPDLDGYKTDHSALFFAIVDSINRNGWKDTEIEYDRMINKVRLGKENYLKGRKWLQLHGFIAFKPGKGDYAKAKFGLGYAVLGKTAPDTAEPALPAPVAVLPRTAEDTAEPTLPVVDAVLSKTAGDTAPNTAPGTASDTYLIKEPITTNDLPITSPQHHQQQPADAGAVVSDEKKESDSSSEENKKKETPPQPLPTADGVRIELATSAPHRRYALEQLKVAQTDDDYTALIDLFITQRECEAEEGKPAFKSIHDVRRHFMNWLGTTHTRTTTTNPSNGNAKSLNGNKRTQGSLRPTAIGVPDYRGKGSDCHVDL